MKIYTRFHSEPFTLFILTTFRPIRMSLQRQPNVCVTYIYIERDRDGYIDRYIYTRCDLRLLNL